MALSQSKVLGRLRKKDASEVIEDRLDEEDGETTVDTSVSNAQAHVTVSRTINLGDFNSVKVEVGATVPCDPNDVPEMLDQTKGLVLKRLIQYVSELNEDE